MEPFQNFEFKDLSGPKNLPINILVVEDDKINQFVLSKHLQKWGFKFMIASCGYEALELIKSKQFQVVLMDVNLPDIDGSEVTKRIRAIDESYFKNIPVLASSAIVDSKEKAVALGMTDYVSKPLNVVELQSKIVRYLNDITIAPPLRKISIDLDRYSDGDSEFRKELIFLMIRNLIELSESMQHAGDQHNHELFLKTVHKITPTVAMLNDSEFSDNIKALKGLGLNTAVYNERKEQFHRQCNAIIQALDEEIATNVGELVRVKAA